MLNKSLPLPLNTLPLDNLTSPKNKDPLALDDTTNPKLSLTEAVTLPLAMKGATAAGTLIKPLPSPLNEPVNEPVAEDAVIEFTISSVCICTEPVNCCISVISLPKMLLPDEYITDEEIRFTISWSAIIDWDTIKLPKIVVLVFTTKSPSTKDAVELPLAIRVAAGRLTNSEPSPTNEPVKDPVKDPDNSLLPLNEPVNCPLTLSKSKLLTNPLLPSLSDTTIAGLPLSDALKSGTPKLGSAWDKSKNWYLSLETSLGLTTLTLPLNKLLLAIRI